MRVTPVKPDSAYFIALSRRRDAALRKGIYPAVWPWHRCASRHSLPAASGKFRRKTQVAAMALKMQRKPHKDMR